MANFFKMFWYLLNSPQVSTNKKLLFVGLPVLYWFLPDPIPLFFDDLLILALGFSAFVNKGKKDMKDEGKFTESKYNEDYIDVKAKPVDDD